MLYVNQVSIPDILFPISFEYESGICMIKGPSGIGKTTLLKCISNLVSHNGTSSLNGKTPKEYGISEWRSDVLYIPQRPPILPGTPMEFWNAIQKLKCQRRRKGCNPVQIASEWNIQEHLWDQSWNELSGGEIQRIALAIGLSREPKILLLDECTSALDPETTLLVEQLLRHVDCIWISHDTLQCERMADSLLTLRQDGYDFYKLKSVI